MVPSGVVAPRCRPKRAAASKAEGVISEALSGSVDKTDERRAQQADAESDKNAPVETSRPVGWLQQRPAHDVKRVNKGKAKKTSKSRSSQMVCTTPLAKVDTKLEFSSYSGSRRSHESKAGTKRGRESADHNPLASSRGRPTDQLRVKPKPPQGVGGVSCLMKSFAAHGGPRFEIPINPTMQDAWKVLDIVLAYLPSTTVLNVDTLLHLAGAIPRKEGESSAEASSDAGGSAAPDAAPDQSDPTVSPPEGVPNGGGLPSEAWSETGEPPPERHTENDAAQDKRQPAGRRQEPRLERSGMESAKSVFAWDEFDDSKIFRRYQDQYAEEREQAVGGSGLVLSEASSRSGAGSGAGSWAGSWAGAEAGSPELGEEQAALEEGATCAKAGELPRGRLTAAELAACEACLSDAVSDAEAVLMRLGGEVEDLRFDPDSGAMQKWTEWENETIAQYGPLEERTIMERKASRAKQDEELRREALRLQEELQAVCYVCDSGDHSEEDAIVFCERCCVAVHASCYKAVGVHELDKWYCDFCDDLISKARKRLEDALEEEKRLNSTRGAPLESVEGESTEKMQHEDDDDEEQGDGRSRAPSRSNSDSEPEEEPKVTADTKQPAWVSRPTEWPRALSPLDTEVPAPAAPPPAKPPARAISPLDTSPLQVRTGHMAATACRTTQHGRGNAGRKSPQQGVKGHGEAYTRASEWPIRKVGQSHSSPRAKGSPGPTSYPSVEEKDLQDEDWIGTAESLGAGAGPGSIGRSASKVTLPAGAIDRVLSLTRERTLVDDPEERAGATAAAAAFAAAISMAGISQPQTGPPQVHPVSPQKPLAVPAPTRDLRRAAEVMTFGSPEGDDWTVLGADYQRPLSRGERSSDGHARSDSRSSAATEDIWQNGREETGRTPAFGDCSPLRSALGGRGDAADRPTRLPWSSPQHMLQPHQPSPPVNPRRESPRTTAGKSLASFERLKNGEMLGAKRDLDSLSVEEAFDRKREEVSAEVSAAREALEKAEEVVGIDTPSKDKGPREEDAVCYLCPVRGGAFHKTDKVRKNGSAVWCHCLCALTNGLPIVDRLVQVKNVNKDIRRGCDNGERCSVCAKPGRGWLLTCAEPECLEAFHPLCGNRSGGSAERGPHLLPSKWTARCSQHAVAPSSAAADKGDALAMAKGRRRRGSDGGRRASLSGLSADPEMQRFQAEVRESYANRNAACPPGKCHRCRKDRKWTAGCSACSFRFCPTCIASQGESPKAVLAAVKAMAQSLANRKPPPRDAFLCFACRDVCMCTPCSNQRKKAAAKSTKVDKPARAVLLPSERPKIVRPPKPPKPKSRAPFDRKVASASGSGSASAPAAAAAASTSDAATAEDVGAGPTTHGSKTTVNGAAGGGLAAGLFYPGLEFGETSSAVNSAESRAADEPVEIGDEVASADGDDNDRIHRRDDEDDEPSERPRKMSHVDPSLGVVPNQTILRRSPSTSPMAAPTIPSREVGNESEAVMSTQESLGRCDLTETRAEVISGSANVDRLLDSQPGQPPTTTSPSQAAIGIEHVGPSLPAMPQNGSRTMPGPDDSSHNLLTEEEAAIFPWMSPEPLPPPCSEPEPIPCHADSTSFSGDMMVNRHVNGGDQYGPTAGRLAPDVSEQGKRKANRRRSSAESSPAPKVFLQVSVKQPGASQSGAAQPPMPGASTNPATPMRPSTSGPASGISCSGSATMPGTSIGISTSGPGSGIPCPSPAPSVSVAPVGGGSLKGSPEQSQVRPAGVLSGKDGANRAPGVKGILDHIPFAWKDSPESETSSTPKNGVSDRYPLPATNLGPQPAPGVSGIPGVQFPVPPSPVTTASVMKARASRAHATQAAADAQKAVEAMKEAKSCSDLNNRAAMWRVQRATQLKDTLLGTNDLVSSFGKLKIDAENKVRAAATEESNALSCLRESEAELRRLMNHVTTLSNGWLGDPPLETGTNPVLPVGRLFRPGMSENCIGVDGGGPRMTTPGAVGSSGLSPSNGIDSHPVSRSTSASPTSMGWDASAWWSMDDGPLAAPPSASSPRGLGPPGLGVPPGQPVSQPGGSLSSRVESFDCRFEDAEKRVKTAADAAIKAREHLVSKQNALSDLAAALSQAEDSRANLVTQTQSASDNASKASAAAMQKEEYARVKAQEARAAQEAAAIAEWEAQRAEWEARAAVEIDRTNASRSYFGAFGRPGSAVGPAVTMNGGPGSTLGPQEGLVGLGHVEMDLARGDRGQDLPSRQMSQHRV